MASETRTDTEEISMEKSENNKANYNKAKNELDSVMDIMLAQIHRMDLGEKLSKTEQELTLELFFSKFNAFLDEAKNLIKLH